MVQTEALPAPASLTGTAKLAQVTALLAKLKADLDRICLLPQQRDAALEELKVYGRDPAYADPIFMKDGIETLTRHAFHSPSNVTSRNAMRCLANAMLLKPESRQIFVDLEYEPDPGKPRLTYLSKACNKLKNDSWDDEFLISRILFLTTYGTNISLPGLIENNGLADLIVQKLARHAKQLTEKAGKTKADPMEDTSLVEILKLMFNVTNYCPDHVATFTPAIPHIIALLWKHDISPSKPLDHPFRDLVNSLLNLHLGSKDAQQALFPKGNPNAVAQRLLDILGNSMKVYDDTELEQSVTPLVGVIRKLYGVPHAPASAKEVMRKTLLPTNEDRNMVLGQGQTLPSRLLRNSANPMTPQLREAINNLLFDLSDKDASKFVDNVGYGFASGFLFQNGMAIPSSASEAFATGDAEDARRPINPITGQFLDAQKPSDEPEMTQEEKEREAERLFVLFERLRRNGIIQVENPLRTAVEQGTIEELDDDVAEDLD